MLLLPSSVAHIVTYMRAHWEVSPVSEVIKSVMLTWRDA